MDAFAEHHGCPTKLTSKIDKVSLQVSHDGAASRLYFDWNPFTTSPALHLFGYDHHPGITCIIECRAIGKRVCIRVRKDFVHFTKKPQRRPTPGKYSPCWPYKK